MDAIPLSGDRYMLSQKAIKRWQQTCLLAIKKNGKRSAGPDPIEMIENMDARRLRIFVLGSSPMIELIVGEKDWEYAEEEA